MFSVQMFALFYCCRKRAYLNMFLRIEPSKPPPDDDDFFLVDEVDFLVVDLPVMLFATDFPRSRAMAVPAVAMSVPNIVRLKLDDDDLDALAFSFSCFAFSFSKRAFSFSFSSSSRCFSASRSASS